MEPMTYERREEIRRDLAAITTNRPPAYADRDRARDTWTLNSSDYAAELLADLDRLTDLFEKLAATVGRLDFDRSESAIPETQEQWIEFIREIDDRAQVIIEQNEES